MAMKVLVTGGAGFIGSHIVDRAVELGYRTVIIDNLSTGKREHINPQARFYQEDIRSAELKRILEHERPDVVIHHAAQIDVQHSIADPGEDAAINISGTVNLLEACVKAGVRKFIYASSAAVYGQPIALPVTEEHPKQPISFYGVSKFVPEYYIQTFASLYGMEYTILRYANVYGIRQDPKGEGGVISIFLDRALRGETLRIFGDGSQTRDFIYVGDIAEANMQAIHHGSGRIVNIGTSSAISLVDLVRTFETVTGKEQTVSFEDARPGDIQHSSLDNRMAVEHMNWLPQVNLSEGIKRTCEYYAPLYAAKKAEEALDVIGETRKAAAVAVT